jgi:hypothetical protein
LLRSEKSSGDSNADDLQRNSRALNNYETSVNAELMGK